MVIKLFYALCILVLTLFGGLYLFNKRKQRDYVSGESLACGVFLGAGLLHMLSDASHSFTQLGFDYPIASLIAGMVFLVFLWLEHLGEEWHLHQSEESSYFALLALMMMSVHSFLAGAALGLSTEVSMTAILFLAIVGHKLAESFAIAVHLVKSKLSKPHQYMAFGFYALMTPLGIMIGHLVVDISHQMPMFEPIIAALAAGTFLYLGTLHGLDKCVLVKQCCNLKYYSFVILGFLIMAVMAFV